MECSIIIVNFNTKDFVSNCIRSIVEHTTDVFYEIIVVDNGSYDGSQEEIKTNFPQVQLIESEKNLGFGKANNLAAKFAKGDYLFFLNSDTLLLNNVIKFFLNYFRQNVYRKLGCIGCNLLGEDYKINGNGGQFPKISHLLKSRFYALRFKFFDKDIEKIFCDKIDYILGADIFMPHQIFKEVNGFDEQFFMYFEESDLQLRVAQLGYAIEIIEGPRIIHLEGKSSYNSIRKMIMVQESAYKYYYKNRPFWEYYLLKLIGVLDSFLLLFKSSYTFKDFITYLKFNLQPKKK
jgi:hypothetical protein